MSVGTMPLSIQVVDTRAISASRGTAGSICVQLMRMPRRMAPRVSRRVGRARATARAAEPRSTKGLHWLMASGPMVTMRSMSTPNNSEMGSTDSHRGICGTSVALSPAAELLFMEEFCKEMCKLCGVRPFDYWKNESKMRISACKVT